MSLKAAIAKSQPNRMKCSVALLRAKLTPEQRIELDEACALSIDELTHATLARAIRAEYRFDNLPQSGTLQRHRAKQCSCVA